MKKLLMYTITGLFLAGVTGIAQAAGSNAGIDFQTEGPAYNYGSEKPTVRPVAVINQGSRYIEGMGFVPSDKVQKTIVMRISDHCDYCSEGLTAKEIDMHFKMANQIEPAAGN